MTLVAGRADSPADIGELARYALAPTAQVLADPESARWAAVRVLDGLANMRRGASSPVSVAVSHVMSPRRHADRTGWDASAWPDDGRVYRADDAAFLMGTFAFSESYSDTGIGSVAHPGSVVVPGLLLASQLHPHSGRAALAAVVVGYNIMESLGRYLNGGNPRMSHQLKGFRPTASVGPIAACAVLCRLAGSPEHVTRHALSIACNQGGGLRRHPQTALSSLYVQSGEALRRALQSAELAAAQVEGDDSMLWGDGGFIPAYGTDTQSEFQLPVVGVPGAVATASVKLDCTPHTFITALDAARQLAERDFASRAASRVTVRLPRQHCHAAHTGRAWARPETLASAMYDLRFCVAAAFVSGRHLYPGELSLALADPVIARLAPCVRVIDDAALTAMFDADPTTWPAAVEAEDDDGFRGRLELLRPLTFGWPAKITAQAVVTKAQSLADPGRMSHPARLERLLAELDTWPDFWDSLIRLAPFGP